MKNAAIDDQFYREFYEAVGADVPETEHAHAHRHRPWSRYNAVLGQLRKLATPDWTLLDVGCADGVYTIPWRQMGGGSALGLDIAPGFAARATQGAHRQGVDGISFVAGDIQDASLDLGRFDVVLMSEVLEHLNHPERAMRNVRRHLKDGGVLLITTPTPVFELMAPVGLRLRYIRGLLARRLKEEQVMPSGERVYLRDHGLAGYLYRHDAYWPHILPRWIEGFGFQPRTFYTLGWGWPPSVVSFPLLGHLEMILRHVPGMNLFGVTNLGLFEATNGSAEATGGSEVAGAVGFSSYRRRLRESRRSRRRPAG